MDNNTKPGQGNDTAQPAQQSTSQPAQPMQPAQTAPQQGFFKSIFDLLTKPTTAAKHSLERFATPVEALKVIALSVSLNVLTSVLLQVIVILSSKYLSFKYVEWGDIILAPLLSSLIFSSLITSAFIAVERIFNEKRSSFLKIWSLTAVASLPLTIFNFFISILANFTDSISAILAILSVITALYTVMIFLYGWQSELGELEGNKKFLINFISIVSFIIVMAIIQYILSKSDIDFILSSDIFEMLDY